MSAPAATAARQWPTAKRCGWPSKYTCIYIFIRLILVRSMRRAMVSMILVLSGCVTPPTQITGRYATRLSNSDLQQIKRLVAGDPKLDHRVAQVDVVTPNRARVKVGGIQFHGWSWEIITLIKHRGSWVRDYTAPPEAEAESNIITY